jgi:hypothetical protein
MRTRPGDNRHILQVRGLFIADSALVIVRTELLEDHSLRISEMGKENCNEHGQANYDQQPDCRGTSNSATIEKLHYEFL